MSDTSTAGTITVCPYCDSASVKPRNGRGLAADSDADYYCEGCQTALNEPIEREPRADPGLYGTARVLAETDPDDLVTDGGTKTGDTDEEVLAGEMQIKVREDRVKLSYTIGGKVGGCWGETVEEAFQNFAQHHGDEDLRPNPEEGRYILPDVNFPRCPNCGDYSAADHHEWVGERIVGCSVDSDTDRSGGDGQ